MKLDVAVQECGENRIEKGSDRLYYGIVRDGTEEKYRSVPLPKELAQADAIAHAARLEGHDIDPEKLRPQRRKRVSRLDPQEEEMFPETRPASRTRTRLPKMG